MKPLFVRAFGRFYMVKIPDWLDLWLMRRAWRDKAKPGDTITLPSHVRLPGHLREQEEKNARARRRLALLGKRK